MGRRKRPFYRLVAIDSRKRRDGAELERLGWFDPLHTDVAVEIKEDRVLHWLGQGAQPSETVDNIFTEIGLNYKRHLIREGKSEEEIATLLTEWQANQAEKKAALAEKKAAKKKAVPVEEAGDSSQEAGTEDKSEEAETADVKAEEAAPEEEAGESSQEAGTEDKSEEAEAAPAEEAGDSSEEAGKSEETAEESKEEN